MRRFYFPELSQENSYFSIPQQDIKHITKVLRLKEGDLFEVSNGTGLIFELVIVSVNSDEVICNVNSFHQGKEIPLQSIAFLAELKSDAMDDAISILAEHGIQKIIPFYASRSISRPDNIQKNKKKQERRQKLAHESIKKVGGLYSCFIYESISFKDIPQYLSQIPQKIIFYESENSPSKNLSTLDFTKDHGFFIGPEGGFTNEEIKLLQSWSCVSYSLGTRILRAPQAVSAAATLLRYFTENQ